MEPLYPDRLRREAGPFLEFSQDQTLQWSESVIQGKRTLGRMTRDGQCRHPERVGLIPYLRCAKGCASSSPSATCPEASCEGGIPHLFSRGTGPCSAPIVQEPALGNVDTEIPTIDLNRVDGILLTTDFHHQLLEPIKANGTRLQLASHNEPWRSRNGQRTRECTIPLEEVIPFR